MAPKTQQQKSAPPEKKPAAAAAQTQQLAKPSAVVALGQLIESKRGAFAAVAAKHFDVDRLVKLAQSALSRNPKLVECTATSLLLCLVRCAELGLEPDAAIPTKRMWLVPRWNSKLNKGAGGTECTYIIDYRAQLNIARESGMVSSIAATEVCEKDKRSASRFSSDGDSIQKFDIEIDPFADRGPVIGYIAAARLTSGETQAVYLSRKQAELHRDRYGPKYKGAVVGPWKSEFDPMALKTVLRKLFNLLPAGQSKQATQLEQAIRQEQALEVGEPARLAPAERALIGGIPGEPETTADEVAEALAGAASLADQVEEQQEEEEEKTEAGEAAGEEEPDEPGSRG